MPHSVASATSLLHNNIQDCTLMHNIWAGMSPRYPSDIVQPTTAKGLHSALCYLSETVSYIIQKLCTKFRQRTSSLAQQHGNLLFKVFQNKLENLSFKTGFWHLQDAFINFPFILSLFTCILSVLAFQSIKLGMPTKCSLSKARLVG